MNIPELDLCVCIATVSHGTNKLTNNGSENLKTKQKSQEFFKKYIINPYQSIKGCRKICYIPGSTALQTGMHNKSQNGLQK